jgi:tetratricopeptide (TPR) repeat protein
MPRFYLTFLLCWLPFFAFNQVKLKDLIQFGDEQFSKGDYYYAGKIYQQALTLDSTSSQLHWKQAETQRAYKNYTDAAKWYAKVYAEDPDKVYPNALIYYALMVKQSGNYTQALTLFKKAYKESAQFPDEYAYKKAKQEIKSTEFALKSKPDTSVSIQAMPEGINSFDAEFGHTYKNGVFYFSSLKADSINNVEEVYTKYYRTRNYTSSKDSNGFTNPKQWEALSTFERSTGNGSFDDKGWYYYSICNDKGYNYNCKIAKFKTENGVNQIDTLSEVINAPNSNNTNPVMVKLKNGKSYLFFSSDREGGQGGMDIWYAQLKSNGTYERPKNISAINSMENEITPWFDVDSSKLYFSSNWHFGFGGYDVFSSRVLDKFQFSKPTNLGTPINNPANDLYFFRQTDSIFVSSNRLGSLSKKNPTCCSDIFYAVIPPPPPSNVIPPDSTQIDSVRITFPVTLYFRNDYPNPKSYAKKSNVPYDLLYADYFNARKGYLDSVVNKDALSVFFTGKVDFGYEILLKLYDSVAHEIERGNSILLFARGYASPLNVTQYNVNLTQRRISSIERYFLEFQNNRLKLLLSKNPSVSFEIVEVPLGEYAANQSTSDNLKDKAASVYSLEACIERKVEILYLARTVMDQQQTLSANPLVQSEEIKEGQNVHKKITLSHTATEISIEQITFSQEGLSYKLKKIAPNETELDMEFIPEFSGKHASCYADIYFTDIENPVRVYFTFLKK